MNLWHWIKRLFRRRPRFYVTEEARRHMRKIDDYTYEIALVIPQDKESAGPR